MHSARRPRGDWPSPRFMLLNSSYIDCRSVLDTGHKRWHKVVNDLLEISVLSHVPQAIRRISPYHQNRYSLMLRPSQSQQVKEHLTGGSTKLSHCAIFRYLTTHSLNEFAPLKCRPETWGISSGTCEYLTSTCCRTCIRARTWGSWGIQPQSWSLYWGKTTHQFCYAP